MRKMPVNNIRNQLYSFSIRLIIIILILQMTQPVSVIASPEPTITLLTDFNQVIIKKSILIEWIAEDEHNESLEIYIFYKDQNDIIWQRVNDQSLSNTGSFLWNCSTLQDGHYLLKIEAINSYHNIAHDNSALFTIDNDNSLLSIRQIQFRNLDTENNQYVKDKDTVQLIITIDNANNLTKDRIYADLRCFQKEENVHPNYFNGHIAQWNLSMIKLQQKNANISITVDVDHLEKETIHIMADNTKPTIHINHPINGLYLLNKRFIPIKDTIIIGNIPLDFEANDNYEVEKALIYLDGLLIDEISQPPFFKLIKEKLFGKHIIKIECVDKAANLQTETIALFMWNIF
jgi:hypothetical protein